jgi:hypothetical protein
MLFGMTYLSEGVLVGSRPLVRLSDLPGLSSTFGERLEDVVGYKRLKQLACHCTAEENALWMKVVRSRLTRFLDMSGYPTNRELAWRGYLLRMSDISFRLLLHMRQRNLRK